MILRVAGAQIPVTNDISCNVAGIEEGIDFAADSRADILLTPEGSMSGYTNSFDIDTAREALASLTRKARDRRLGLALGTCFVEDDGGCFNEIRFYGKDGDFLGFHTKTLLCGTLTDPPTGEVRKYSTRPLRVFQIEGIPCGGLICNDLWANPQCTPMADDHLTQKLSRMGVKIIFHAVNGGRGDNEFSRVVARQYHESNLRMRAKAGRVFIVTVDSAFPTHEPCASPGGVVGVDGNWVKRIPMVGRQFFVCDIQV